MRPIKPTDIYEDIQWQANVLIHALLCMKADTEIVRNEEEPSASASGQIAAKAEFQQSVLGFKFIIVYH